MIDKTATAQGFARFSRYYRPHWRDIALGLLFLLGASLIEPLIPALMKILLDHAGSSSPQLVKAARWPVWAVPVAVIALFAGRSIFVFLTNLALGSVNSKAVTQLQADLFNQLGVCDFSLYEKESTSSLINTLRIEVSAAGSAFVTIVQDGGRNLLTALGLTTYLFWMNWKLTLLALIILPLVALLVRAIGQRMRRVQFAQQQGGDALGYVIEENTQAHRTIRLYGAQTQQKNRFWAAIQYFRGQNIRAIVASSAMTPVSQISASLALALILSVALKQSDSGQLTVGDLAAYVTAMLMLVSPVKGLGDVFPALHRGRVALTRIYGVMDYPLEPSGGAYAPMHAEGRIEFKNIIKSYVKNSAPALNDVSITIEPRQMVALVGASGSGKSTLANVLAHFVLPDDGEVRIDGVSSKDWSLPVLRSQMAMVSQDTVLLNDTVLANVCLGASQPDTDRARKALLDAHLWEHVRAMPNGLDTVIGHNGQTLSGGQRQRLAIARALYKASPILILDEATSALDAESERLVQEALGKLSQGRTTLVIAHRLSTVRHADMIVVMDKGKVVEQGSYQQLIQNDKFFARLVQQQLAT